ncbi:uncharacterized protein LOC101753314 [Setaria italica]|uniref:uncharacterized protein LOC101753314 n=1 Tax=Setaria italica TaxID=4555 RepID=UPI000BE54B8C|nr:uncharacterized protein LOC101753314 [Setaria italica]
MDGLKALGYEFDNDEFHANVHGTLPYHNLRPDPVLRTLLLSIPQRKIVFTNSDKAHAEEAMHRLGLQGCFDGVICFETLNPCNGLICSVPELPKSPILCKPSIEAMKAAIRIANVDPKKTVFFDDSTRNIASGKAAGFHTVIVCRSTLVPGADHALESIHNIKEALPEI